MARRCRAAALLVSLACAARCAAGDAAGDAAVERFRAYLRIRTEQPTPDYVAAAAFLQAQGEDIGCVHTSAERKRLRMRWRVALASPLSGAFRAASACRWRCWSTYRASRWC
jgi:hypothetical protein